MTGPIIPAAPPIRSGDLEFIRNVLDIVVRPGVEARVQAAPTALAGGYTYEIVLRRFIPASESLDNFRPRHLSGTPDESHIVRSTN